MIRHALTRWRKTYLWNAVTVRLPAFCRGARFLERLLCVGVVWRGVHEKGKKDKNLNLPARLDI